MCISHLIQKRSSLDLTSKMLIITDNVQKDIALAIQDDGVYDVRIEYYSQTDMKFLNTSTTSKLTSLHSLNAVIRSLYRENRSRKWLLFSRVQAMKGIYAHKWLCKPFVDIISLL